MAEIDTSEENFSSVQLTINDRLLIKASIDKYCKVNGITLKEIASELKISRAQLYIIFESRSLDLITLIKLQKKFNFSILDSTEVESFISLLEFDLFPIHQDSNLAPSNDYFIRKSYRDEWLRYCRFQKVNSYYAFLYLRHIGDFLWIDDREYLRKNKEDLPYWNSKYKYDRYDNSTSRIPLYKEALDLTFKRKQKNIKDKDRDKNKPKYTMKEIEEFYEKDSGVYETFLENDKYSGKKISEFIENALIARVNESETEDFNKFGVAFNFPKKPLKIIEFEEYINIPIAGSSRKWGYYEKFVYNVIKCSPLEDDIKEDHQKYHMEFMKKINKLLLADEKNIEEIDETMGGDKSFYKRYRSIFPKELSSFKNNKDKYSISYEFTDNSLKQEALYSMRTEWVLEKNNWGSSQDVTGTQLSNKKYYADLVAFKESNLPDKDTDGVQFTFKYFKNANSLQVSTLERIKKTTAIDKWDRHIIISNLPFSKKCRECAENSNIFLILESEIENLMEYMKF